MNIFVNIHFKIFDLQRPVVYRNPRGEEETIWDKKQGKSVVGSQNIAKVKAKKPRQNLPDSISECLMMNIENGVLQPGMILLNSELARFFNVSRIPVNEAMQNLASQGIVEKRAAQGYVVPGSGQKEVRTDISRIVVPKNLAGRFDRQPSWERIYSAIEEELVSLMPYGTFRINESSMTSHYGVNRNMIQQVLTRLCERGIAEKPSQSHCHLLAYDKNFICNRYELRTILEPVALAKSANHTDLKDIQSSLKAHKQVQSNFAARAKTWLPKLEQQMHVDLIKKCQNGRILTALSSAQMPLITTTKMIRRVLGSEVEEPLVAEHIAILEPLADGDIKQASLMMKAHLDLSMIRSIERLPQLTALKNPNIPSFLRER